MESRRSSRKIFFFFLVWLFLFCASFLFFGASVDNFFVSDDFLLLDYGKNFSIEKFFEPLLDSYFRPFLGFLYSTLLFSFGLEPSYYRLFAILMHSVNAFLVFLFARKILKNSLPSFFASFFFLVFFLNYEVLFQVSTLNEIFLFFFSILSLLFFAHYLEHKRKAFYAFSFAFFSLALLTKESAVILFIIFILFEFFFHSKGKLFSQTRKRALLFAPFFFAALLSASLKALLAPFYGEAPHLFFYLLFYRDALAFLLLPAPDLLVFLVQSSVDFPFRFAAGILFIVFFLALNYFVFFRSRKPAFKFSLLWIYFTLLLPLAFGSPQARYFYLPSAGSSILIGYFLWWLIKSSALTQRKLDAKRFAGIVFSAVVIVLIVGSSFVYTWQKESEWDSAGKISESTLAEASAHLSYSPEAPVFFVYERDSFEGIFFFDRVLVWRNGFEEAMELFHGISPEWREKFSLSEVFCENPEPKQGKLFLLFNSSEKKAKKIECIRKGENILSNPGFEIAENGKPVGWTGKVIQDNSRAFSGNSSGLIAAGFFPEEKAFSVDYPTGKSHAYYLLSAKAFGEGSRPQMHLFGKGKLYSGFLLNFDLPYWEILWFNIRGESGWFKAEKIVEVPPEADSIYIRLDNDGSGKVWFDEVELRKIEPVFGDS